jgi:hypothetical protein
MSISLRSRIRQAFLLGCVSGAALLTPLVGQAAAATYPGAGSTFTGSAEGWKATSNCQLLSALELPLLCTATGAYDATAGAPPGSFAATTNIPLNLIGLFKSEVVAESPTFTAVSGGAGSLGFSRAFTPGGLIAINPQFTYTINLVDKTANAVEKVTSETLEGETPFANKIAVLALTTGHEYQVQIDATTSSSLASIGLLEGVAIGRFDNVVVTGPDAPEKGEKGETGEKGEKGATGEKGTPGANGTNGSSGSNGTNGASGSNGTDGSNGSNGANGANGANGGEGSGGSGSTAITSSELKSIAGSALTGSATMSGNRLSVKAGCPTKAGTACTISLQGMVNRHQAATAGRKAKVKAGKSKNFALSVKPASRAVMKTKSKLLFKVTIKAGTAAATVYKTLPLIHR